MRFARKADPELFDKAYARQAMPSAAATV